MQSSRRKAVKPSNAKISDVGRILSIAAEHSSELMDLWEKTHGSAS